MGVSLFFFWLPFSFYLGFPLPMAEAPQGNRHGGAISEPFESTFDFPKLDSKVLEKPTTSARRIPTIHLWDRLNPELTVRQPLSGTVWTAKAGGRRSKFTVVTVSLHPKPTAPSHSRSVLCKFSLHYYWMTRSTGKYRTGGSASPTSAKAE